MARGVKPTDHCSQCGKAMYTWSKKYRDRINDKKIYCSKKCGGKRI